MSGTMPSLRAWIQSPVPLQLLLLLLLLLLTRLLEWGVAQC